MKTMVEKANALLLALMKAILNFRRIIEPIQAGPGPKAGGAEHPAPNWIRERLNPESAPAGQIH